MYTALYMDGHKKNKQLRPGAWACKGTACLTDLKTRLVEHGRWRAPLFDTAGWAATFGRTLQAERAAWLASSSTAPFEDNM